MSSQPAAEGDVSVRERYLLTAIFGSLIVAAFVYQASVMAAEMGWVAYPFIAAIGIASFSIARTVWLRLATELQAHADRREHIEGTNAD